MNEMGQEDRDYLVFQLNEAIKTMVLIDKQRPGHTKARAYQTLLCVLHLIMKDNGLSEKEIAAVLKAGLMK